MKPTGLLFFPAFDWSLGESHPEREERLLYTRDQIFEEGILDLPNFKEFTPRLAGLTDIARTHALLPRPEGLVTAPHLIAAGSVIALADAIMAGEIKQGFALVRPPGHHAMYTVYGNRGFCTVNNVGVVVNYLRSRYKIRRIAIVDTDVHHGDGTQDIFYYDPDILYISIHQDGRTLYPGSGFPGERGGAAAWDKTLNIPLPPGTGDEGLLYVLQELILPTLEEFKPQLIINSAGQDNHFTDPLANMLVTARGYAKLTELLQPDLVVLEGGYAIESALPHVNLAILLALAGLDYSNVEEEVTGVESIGLSSIKPLVKAIKARKRLSPVIDPWNTFEKRVFYDAEQLWEKRVEKIGSCPCCSGLRLVATGASTTPDPAYDNYVITLPFGVCHRCRDTADQELQVRRQTYNNVFWQDQQLDRFIYYCRGEIREMSNE